jgi:hypothetical protein
MFPVILGLTVRSAEQREGGRKLTRALALLGLSLALLSMLACDQVQEAPKAPVPATAEIKTPAKIDTDLIGTFDMTMKRSTAFRMDGDLRPIWIVSGRIRNLSDVEVKSVSIRIEIDLKGEPTSVDSTILTVDTEIQPHSVGSFSRSIQLMPPDKAWEWDYNVVKAVAK